MTEEEIREDQTKRVVHWLQRHAETMHQSDTTYHMAVKDAAAHALWIFTGPIESRGKNIYA